MAGGSRVARRVSVVIPAYNAARFIECCLDSVLAQDWPDIQVIVGDDGSVDGTRDILRRYADRHGIELLAAPCNLGPFAIRNRCLERANGEFIAFLDADDFWMPGKLQAQLAMLDAVPEAGLCHSYQMRVDPNGNPTRRLALNSERYVGNCFHLMLRQNGVGTSSVVVRAALIDKIGRFDERFRYRGDWEMWCRAARAAPFAFVPQELVGYRLHDSNVGNDTRKIRRYEQEVIAKFETEYGLGPDELQRFVRPAKASFHRAYGLMALVNRDLSSARADFIASLAYRPFDPTVWMGLIKTLIYRPRAVS